MLLDDSDVSHAVERCREVCRRKETFLVEVNDGQPGVNPCFINSTLRMYTRLGSGAAAGGGSGGKSTSRTRGAGATATSTSAPTCGSGHHGTPRTLRSSITSTRCDSGSLRNDRAKPTDPSALPTIMSLLCNAMPRNTPGKYLSSR